MRQRLGLLLIVAFVALDLVLVSLALRRPDLPSSDDANAATPTAPTAASSPSASTSLRGSAGDTPSAAESSDTPVDDGPVLLSVGPDGSAFRATRGSCRAEEPPVVEISRPSGRRLAATDIKGLTQVLGLDALGGAELRVVGLDADCAIATFSSSDRGDTWRRDAGSTGSWYLAPRLRREEIGTPGGVVDAPCLPTSVSAIDAQSARLLCDTGTVRGTPDGGATWAVLGSLPDAVGIAFTSPSSGWGLADQGGCPATVVRTTNGGAAWERAACARGGPARGIAVRGEIVLVQAGQTLTRSTDGGETFEALTP